MYSVSSESHSSVAGTSIFLSENLFKNSKGFKFLLSNQGIARSLTGTSKNSHCTTMQ